MSQLVDDLPIATNESIEQLERISNSELVSMSILARLMKDDISQQSIFGLPGTPSMVSCSLGLLKETEKKNEDREATRNEILLMKDTEQLVGIHMEYYTRMLDVSKRNMKKMFGITLIFFGIAVFFYHGYPAVETIKKILEKHGKMVEEFTFITIFLAMDRYLLSGPVLFWVFFTVLSAMEQYQVEASEKIVIPEISESEEDHEEKIEALHLKEVIRRQIDFVNQFDDMQRKKHERDQFNKHYDILKIGHECFSCLYSYYRAATVFKSALQTSALLAQVNFGFFSVLAVIMNYYLLKDLGHFLFDYGVVQGYSKDDNKEEEILEENGQEENDGSESEWDSEFDYASDSDLDN